MQKFFFSLGLYFLVSFALPTFAPAQSALNVCATYHCNGAGIPGVHFDLTLTGNSPALPPLNLSEISDTTGCVSFLDGIPVSSNINSMLNVYKDGDPLQGVNTLDLILISLHILGVEPLDSPYKMIAADANKSGSITSFDIVELRNLILGVYPQLPNNTSWRFIDSGVVFPNPNNPFQTIFPDTASLVPGLPKKIYGIKVGDVNCTALTPFSPAGQESLTMPDLSLQTDDIAEVPIYFSQANPRYGFQFGLHFDSTKIELMDILPVIAVKSALFSDHVNVNWSDISASVFLPSQPIYRLRIKALAPLHLADVFTLDTAVLLPQSYPTLHSLVNLRLQFATVATTEPDAGQTILDPIPNPTSAGVRIPLQLEQSTTVSIELLDGLGRQVYRQEQSKGSGNQWLELPATAFPQAGVYVWRVQVGGQARAGRIVRQ